MQFAKPVIMFIYACSHSVFVSMSNVIVYAFLSSSIDVRCIPHTVLTLFAFVRLGLVYKQAGLISLFKTALLFNLNNAIS